LINICKDWKFTYSKTGWNNSFLSIAWLKHFDNITKRWLVSLQQYRFLILNGCEIHIYIAFIEYCISHRIIAYCLPSHTTHLLQPLDVGLFSPLQKAYGKEVDRLTHFGNVAINKGNFLPILAKARTQAYTKDNILRAWRGSGLIPPNPRKVLTKLPTYRDAEKTTKSISPPPIPPTLRNSAAMLRKARQAKLIL